MLKIFVIVILYCVAITEPSSSFVAKQFCRMKDVCPKRSSIACKYTKNPGLKCKGYLLKLSKRKILHWHNYRRNLIALGKIKRFKPAKRMARMKWSRQLQQMAKYNVMTCKFKHDKCRNTNNFPESGQNIYSETSRGKLEKTNKVAHNAFFDERKNCNMNIIRHYRNTKYPVGHFTSMIKYNSDFIGCAAVKFRKNGKNKIIIACNYSSTNVYGQLTYTPGRSGSQCKTGRDKKYRGLCSRKENFTHPKRMNIF